jgi:hypothetical protein
MNSIALIFDMTIAILVDFLLPTDSCLLKVLDELNKSTKWTELHVADNCCFHYRRVRPFPFFL